MDKVHNRIQSHSHFSELISHSIFSYPFSVHDTWGQWWNSNVSRLLRPYIQKIILPIIHTYFIYLYNNTAGVDHRTFFFYWHLTGTQSLDLWKVSLLWRNYYISWQWTSFGNAITEQNPFSPWIFLLKS